MFFGFSVCAQELKDPEWIKEVAQARIVYQILEMKRVRIKKDIVYKTISTEEMRMDLYLPPASQNQKLFPAVLLVHGGAIPFDLKTKPKEWGVFVSYGELIAASGYAAIALNLRFYDWSDLDAPYSDVQDALSYVQKNSTEIGIDNSRICVWTFSAGGLFLSRLLDSPPDFLRCTVAYYPLVETIPEKSTPPEMKRKFSLPETLTHKKNAVVPLFIGRAGKDEPAVNDAVDRTIQLLLRLNSDVVVSNHSQGQHGFDTLDDNERTREIIRSTLLFLQTQLL